MITFTDPADYARDGEQIIAEAGQVLVNEVSAEVGSSPKGQSRHVGYF
jgi:hypothetical protein